MKLYNFNLNNKIALLLVIGLFNINWLHSQYLEPVELIIFSDSLQIGITPGVSLDNSSDIGLASTVQTGIIVGLKSVKRGRKCTSSQFLANISPLMIGWNSKEIGYPFKKLSVDSFNLAKMPFAEDAVFHLGYRYIIKKQDKRTKDLFFFQCPFLDLDINPYYIEMEDTNYRFITFNANVGYQVGQLKAGLSWIDNFLWGGALQIHYMGINEADEFQNSFKTVTKSSYLGKNYWGLGGKITIQYKYVNAYIEIRQYWGLDKEFVNQKYSNQPILLFGVFPNIPIKAKYYQPKVYTDSMY
ncbi:MAG: hypothetical protein ABIJ97_05605 [Bacteroidota bacterium]